MSETLTAWMGGLLGFGLIWLVVFPRQRSSRLGPDAAPIPKGLAWISGFPRTPAVDPGSFGFQFYAVSLLLVNTVLVLFVPEGNRIAWLSLALIFNMLITLIVVEWLRKRRAPRR